MKNCKYVFVKPLKTKGAKLKGTVATVAALCIVCTVFIASLLSSGCNEKIESSEIDDATILKSLDDAPAVSDSLPWNFPIKPGMPEWRNFQSNEEMVKACQIPENVLSALTTDELTKICLQYPLLYDIFAFESLFHGLDKLFDDFNGIRELFKRDDVSNSLTTRYIDKVQSMSFLNETKSDIEKGYFIISISALEALLSRNVTHDDESLKIVLQSLVVGYEEKLKFVDYFKGFGFKSNLYSRGHIIGKIDKSSFEHLPQKDENSVLYSGMADELTVNLIDKMSYQLIH